MPTLIVQLSFTIVKGSHRLMAIEGGKSSVMIRAASVPRNDTATRLEEDAAAVADFSLS